MARQKVIEELPPDFFLRSMSSVLKHDTNFKTHEIQKKILFFNTFNR